MFKQMYPRATDLEMIIKSTYMGNSMDSIISETEGINLYKELSQLQKKVWMHAYKWLSDSQVVLQNTSSEDRAYY